MHDSVLIDAVRKHAQPLDPATSTGFDRLIESCAASRFVLIGEASHGTHEFYDIRARLTMTLILEHGFSAIVVEADWPDAHRVNRYVRGDNSDRTADQALSSFTRFPVWMWRNTVVRDFITSLHEWNDRQPADRRAGFYGMDLYSLYRSRDEVIRYLDRTDPASARRARDRYSCFDHFGEDPQAYGHAVSSGAAVACEEDAVRQLVDLQRRAADYSGKSGAVDGDEHFAAEQNARLVISAEEYYRTMFGGRTSSWNLRDRHMVDTLDALIEHLDKRVRRAKVLVWAHNSHLGDARATESCRRGEWNVGQLVRERHPGEAFLIGFTTHTGTVMASHDWGEPGHVKRVRPGMAGSWERLFHDTGLPAFLLHLREDGDAFRRTLLERAIGVIYRPDTERWSHYFEANLGEQFDALIHIDETQALTPLGPPVAQPDRELVPETYPTGI